MCCQDFASKRQPHYDNVVKKNCEQKQEVFSLSFVLLTECGPSNANLQWHYQSLDLNGRARFVMDS